jgi:hypothetical protein
MCGMELIISKWNCLQPEYLSVPDTDMWRNAMTGYIHLQSVPHCVGSIDRKDVRVKKFKGTRSRNSNYRVYY